MALASWRRSAKLEPPTRTAIGSIAHSGNEWRAAQLAGGAAPAARETNLELTWRAPVADWLTLQPDVQYVWNPGADSTLPNGFAVGLRFEISGSWSR